MILTDDRLEALWKKAIAFWGVAIHADLPRFDPNAPALAFIDLKTRQVTVNSRQLAQHRLQDALEVILAHELGHHLRYPHSLSTAARLELLEQEILPYRDYSLLNLFTDTLINFELGRDEGLKRQLVQVFSAFPREAKAAKHDPGFFFYLTCLEEGLGLDPRSLTGKAGEQLEADFPGCRAEAQLMAQELPNLAPNVFTQFLYFASVFSRFQRTGEEGEPGRVAYRNPMNGDYSRPDAGDYADAIERSGRESEAIRRALKEGWFAKGKIPDGAASTGRRIASLPGLCGGQPRKLAEAMAMHYRRLAERHLFKPPKEKRGGEPIIPSTLSPWDTGDSPKEIDWLASVLASGVDLGTAMPLKRDLIEDEPAEADRERPVRLEIYLDVSGSMPDPKSAINPMTLAAQVLSMSALRAGGQVRALIYSSNHVAHWAWTRSETEISRFLMSYIGGGTDYPFDILDASVKECGAKQPVRVVLTDSDFAYNLQGKEASVQRASGEAPFVTLLNGASSQKQQWVAQIASAGARTIPVARMDQFPQVAAQLARALFEDERGSHR